MVKKRFIDHNGQAATVVDESEFRKKLLFTAREMGCEKEILQVFDKYDLLLRNCTNAQEAKAIAHMGVMEVSYIMDNHDVGKNGALIIDGKVAIEGEKK